MFRLTVVLLAVAACSLGARLPGGLYPRLDGRIVGGRDTTIEEYPHQVSLRYLGRHHCGASILDEDTILTAAHCIEGISAKSLEIVAGTSINNSNGQKVKVAKVIMNKKFNGYDYDVAVLKLGGKLKFGPTAQPIKIVGKNTDPVVGDLVEVTGWGALYEGGGAPSQLQVVAVPVVDRKQCLDAYKYVSEITERMFCAGYKTGGKDACQGDSGGPVIMGDVQVGVVSWGYGCARSQYPGVYTNIGDLREWIDNAWHSN